MQQGDRVLDGAFGSVALGVGPRLNREAAGRTLEAIARVDDREDVDGRTEAVGEEKRNGGEKRNAAGRSLSDSRTTR